VRVLDFSPPTFPCCEKLEGREKSQWRAKKNECISKADVVLANFCLIYNRINFKSGLFFGRFSRNCCEAVIHPYTHPSIRPFSRLKCAARRIFHLGKKDEFGNKLFIFPCRQLIFIRWKLEHEKFASACKKRVQIHLEYRHSLY
jgi:hypothetical protein